MTKTLEDTVVHDNSTDNSHHDSVGDSHDNSTDSLNLLPKVTFNVGEDDSSSVGERAESVGDVKPVVKEKAPDGGWGWFVVLGSFLEHIIMGGFERSDGILYLKLIKQFNGSASATSWVGSLTSTVRLMLGPLSSGLCARFTCRSTTFVGAILMSLGVLLSGLAPSLGYLYLTYGIIGGFGRSLAYAPGLIIVGIYFDKKRGLATGIGSAGVGMGTLIIPLAFEYVFEVFDYFGAFLILSAIPLNLFICAMLFRPLHVHRQIVQAGLRKTLSQNTALRLEEGIPLSPTVVTLETNQTGEEAPRQQNILKRFYQKYITSSETEKKKSQKLFEFSLLKIPSFLFFCIGIAIFTASFKSAFTFLPALAKSKGCSEREAAIMLSVTGVADAFSRIISGYILELKPVKPFRPIIYNSLMFAVVIVSILCPFAWGFVSFCLLGCAYGLITGGYISQKSVIIVDILGADKITHSFGLMIFFQGIGTLIGPPLSGALKDFFGAYDEVFYFCSGLMFVAGLVMIASNICRNLQIKKDKKLERAIEVTEDENKQVLPLNE
ncbi:monocarboxylate transporter 12-B [Patella vulgata]|uniref:monocarboxylate transporter 12-B n=1 Tax=Patella vulgata TaxID=6465 RepID=UPI00217F54DC|nr:monocarboxylate transporter 12-B [Patella vulgata]